LTASNARFMPWLQPAAIVNARSSDMEWKRAAFSSAARIALTGPAYVKFKIVVGHTHNQALIRKLVIT
jgi:hypothetical protein